MEETVEDVTTFKIKCLIAILVTGLGGGLLPMKLRVKDRLLSLGNTLSGGVFLAAGIAHMFPEAVEGFEKLELKTTIPLAYVFCMSGMLGTFFFEKVLVSGRHNHGAIPPLEESSEDKEENRSESRDEASLSRGIVKTEKSNSWLLPLLLSIHSLVEGIALGFEDTKEDTTKILIAIVGHKLFAAFALGVNLTKNNVSSDRLVKMVVFFAVMTPVGILLGLMAMWNSDHNLIGEAVKAISAGTFIYIALVEVILEEFENTRDKYLKFLLVVVGAIAMCLVSSSGNHHHS